MAVVHRQTLEITSSARIDGTPCRYSVLLPDGAVTCQPDQHLRLSLVQFACFNPFLNVHSGNSRFFFSYNSPNIDANGPGIDVRIPPGTYRFRDLERAINAQTQHPNPALSVTCTFDMHTNGFVFTASSAWSLHFFGTSWQLLGFSPTDRPYASSIRSTQIIDPQPVRTINLAIDGVTPAGRGNYSNTAGYMKATTTLMSIAVGRNMQPFDTIEYTAPGNGLFAVHIQEKCLNELCIRVTDHTGADLKQLPEHSLLLQVETVDRRDGAQDTLVQVRDLLARQLELSRLQLLAKQLAL